MRVTCRRLLGRFIWSSQNASNREWAVMDRWRRHLPIALALMLAGPWLGAARGEGVRFQILGYDGGMPAVDDGYVAFAGRGEDDYQFGVRRYDTRTSSMSIIANHQTIVPQRNVTFSGWGNWGVAVDGQDVAFFGSHAEGSGIYAQLDGQLVPIIDTSMPVPGGVGNFEFVFVWSEFFQPFAIENRQVAFHAADSEGNEGIFRYRDGVLEAIANEETAIPNWGGSFDFFANPTMQNDSITFLGYSTSNEYGIYNWNDGTIKTLVDTSTLVPGLDLPFAGFSNYASDGENLLFIGDYHTALPTGGHQSHAGVYSLSLTGESAGEITQLLSDHESWGLDIDGQPIVSIIPGSGSSDISAYVSRLGQSEWERILGPGDTIDFFQVPPVDGSQHSGFPDGINFLLGTQALSGNHIAIYAPYYHDFGGGSIIILATVPEPASGALMLAGIALLWLGKRGRSRSTGI
jgi:hypothetical protein